MPSLKSLMDLLTTAPSDWGRGPTAHDPTQFRRWTHPGYDLQLPPETDAGRSRAAMLKAMRDRDQPRPDPDVQEKMDTDTARELLGPERGPLPYRIKQAQERAKGGR